MSPRFKKVLHRFRRQPENLTSCLQRWARKKPDSVHNVFPVSNRHLAWWHKHEQSRRSLVRLCVCVCHTEKEELTKHFVSAACFLRWDSVQSVHGSRTPTVEVLCHSTVETGSPVGHFLNVPSWCAHAASGMVGNKRGLVNSQNRWRAGRKEGNYFWPPLLGRS